MTPTPLPNTLQEAITILKDHIALTSKMNMALGELASSVRDLNDRLVRLEIEAALRKATT